MNMKKTILVITLFTLAGNLNAQLLKKLKKTAEKALEKEVENVLGSEEPSVTSGNKKKEKNIKIEENSSLKELEDYTLTYESPSDDFADVRIQTYKGLLRLGSTYSEEDGALGTRNGRRFGKRVKGQVDFYNYLGYFLLFDMKNNLKLFDDLGQNYILSRNGENKNESQYQAQYKLLWLKQVLSNNGVKRNYQGYAPGFDGKNQFETNKNYQLYVKNQLPLLKKWSKEIFTKEKIEAYYVSKTYFGPNSYDFDKEGYWLKSNGPEDKLIRLSSLVEYRLKDNKKSMTSKGSNVRDVFFPVEPSKAEELNNKVYGSGKQLFFVQKINLFIDKNANNSKSPLKTGYEYFEFTDDAVEIYLGDDLVNKIGEINVSSAIVR